ncbi:uncharacterized protein LOC125668338 [Ostrea edulis]|uniref:uncharacterized protein LOC125668338 n=1 Tax=Ostrea edulis TaxID=37623 RepID=UPI00209544DD|nr:uncharacterized protein LOC125668338 [Ostrea edulis]
MKWWTFITILVIVISLVHAKGGRGGGGFRGRGYRGGSRGSSRSSRSYRSSFSGNRLSSSSSIRSALLLGTVYGASRYRQRTRFRSDGTLPVVCYNDRYNMSANGTVSLSYKGRFFCPLDESMSEDYRYCCGEEGLQYCCKFWDVPGHIAGVVIGVIAFAVLLFIGVFCIIRHCSRSRRSPSTPNVKTFNGHENPPAYQPPAYEMHNSQANDKLPYPSSTNYTYGMDNNGYTPSAPYPATDSTWGTKY